MSSKKEFVKKREVEMYFYDEENEMYVFKGDLTEYLLKYGISVEHINKTKNKILETNKSEYYEYVPTRSPERGYEALVPLDKVIGTSRGTVGLSVYENVRIMKRSKREADRFERCLSLLDNLSLDELRESYQTSIEPVQMAYYVEDDKYFLSGNGNHRTLTAMLVGAKYIRAKVTNAYCDVIKKEKFLCSKAFKERYKIILIRSLGNMYDIIFEDKKGVYEICGYPACSEDEDLFSFLKRLSKIIDKDIKKANCIKKMPAIIQKLILHYARNYRIEQYVNRKYLTGLQCHFWGNRHPVELYDL